MQFIKARDLVGYCLGDKVVKPCPFCGETEEIYIEEYNTAVGARWRILCCGCMASIDRGYDQNAYSLLDLWNNRRV